MPRVGGMAMLVGVAVALLFWLPTLDQAMKAWLIGAGIVFTFGVWDDRATLPPRVKLFGQSRASRASSSWRIDDRFAHAHRAAHAVGLAGGTTDLSVPARCHERREPRRWARRACRRHDAALLRGARAAGHDLWRGAGGGDGRGHGRQPPRVPALQYLSGARVHGRWWQPVPRLYRGDAGADADAGSQCPAQHCAAADAARVAGRGYAHGDGAALARWGVRSFAATGATCTTSCWGSGSITPRPCW